MAINHEGITLGVAQLKDAPRIAQMSRDLVERGLGWGWRTPRVAQQLKSTRHVNLAARHVKRGLIGFALMAIKGGRGHLLLLAVEPKYRRFGVGRALIERLIEVAILMDLEAIVLEVRVDNTSAQQFYEALGFKRTEHVKGYYQNKSDAYRMVYHPEPKPIEGLKPGITLEDWLKSLSPQ